MTKSRRLLSFLLFLCLSQSLIAGAPIQPVERSVGKLNISIDPRMELLSTVQLLSDYPYITRGIPYSKEILAHFESFATHNAVAMTDSLFQKYGFSLDAPVTFMLHLSQPSGLETQIVISDYLRSRSGKGHNLERYQTALRQFVEVSDFEAFWNSKIPFYNQILDRTIADMGGIDFVNTLENYFNETEGSYNIIISPPFDGGKGPSMPNANGKNDIYVCVEADSIQDGIPYISRDEALFYIWHEFGHSFVNPLTDKYAARVSASGKLYKPIERAMRVQRYGDWTTCVNEHIIRAINIRLIDLHIDSQSAASARNKEKSRHFIYIDPLIEKLKEFEARRDRDNITFSEFYPELLDVLDNLLTIEYWKNYVDVIFSGPIGAILIERKFAVIYPTNDPDQEALKIAQDYIFEHNEYMPKNDIMLADTVALKTDLSEYGIMAYGTIESNLFLKKYSSTFPFRIENQTIYADKEYTDQNIKFISCLPNPHNKNKGMMIFTALSNRNIIDVNHVPHWDEDYLLFLDYDTIITRGIYKKGENWEFQITD